MRPPPPPPPQSNRPSPPAWYPRPTAVSDANAVSVITERVSDTETRLWTSTIGNVVVYRQLLGASGLQRLATFDHGRNTRFHGPCVLLWGGGGWGGDFDWSRGVHP